MLAGKIIRARSVQDGTYLEAPVSGGVLFLSRSFSQDSIRNS